MTPRLPDDLLKVFAELGDAGDLERILTDLLTPSELKALGERWAIVCRLAAGESQRTVRDALGVSITTVSRGSRQLRYGQGGLACAFDVLAELGLGDPRADPASGEDG